MTEGVPRAARRGPQQRQRERVAEQDHLGAGTSDLGFEAAAAPGDGQTNRRRSRTTSNGAAPSNVSEPSQEGATTETLSGGSSRQSDSSVRWMPPTLGGKSFVTTRVLGISTGRISSQSAEGGAREASQRERREQDALERGRAFAMLPGWRTVAVSGTDARSWLHDLVTADVEGLERRPPGAPCSCPRPAGSARTSTSPSWTTRTCSSRRRTSRSPWTPSLSPYVLSSDVVIEDRTERSVVVAVLDDGAAADDQDGALALMPSVLGAGHDFIVAPGGPADRLRGAPPGRTARSKSRRTISRPGGYGGASRG